MKRQWVLAGTIAVMGFGASLAGQTPQNPTSNTGPQGAITVTGCLQSGASPTGAVGTSGTAAPGETAGTATPGATSASGASGAFTLTYARAQRTSGASTSPGSTAGTATTVPNAAGNTSAGGAAAAKDGVPMTGEATYILSGKETDLRQHVGQQVEIVGRFAANQASGSTTSSTAPSSTGSTSGATGTTGAAGTATGAGRDSSAAGQSAGTTAGRSTGSATGQPATAAVNAAANQPRIDVDSVRMLASTCQK